jgi:amino acid adenylation domain-containing protein
MLQFSLSVELEPNHSGEVLVRATFKEHILPFAQASLLLEQFAAALEDVLDHPNGLMSGHVGSESQLFSVTPPKEPTLDSPVHLLHEFVEYQVARQPNKIAFEFFNRAKDGTLVSRTWTYEDLDKEGERISQWLVRHGIRRGLYVGVCFEKCPEASFAMLGILKTGCAYVAVDPSAPPARKSFIAQDSSMALLLTSDRQAGRFEDISMPVPVIYIDEFLPEELLSETNRSNILSTSPDSVCYCLYTSGTTGTPKGCEITHRNAVQAMRAFSRLFSGRWDEQSKWLQFASYHFDVSVLEQYWSWSEGIRVVSAPRDLIFEDLEATIREMGVTHIDLTPSLASLVKPVNVPSLCKGVFITGGEQLKQDILDAWGEEEVIHNGYGPTETTIGVTMFPRVPKEGKPANIGKQFANVGTYVLRPGTNMPVIRGGVGELCISGELVGKGYLNRPELTAEKFPNVQAFNERIYRTGDLVRICHDNSFIFLGRIDDQVKLRGQRLEIGEINSTIRKSIPAIINVATFVLRHPKQQKDQLVTFLVTESAPKSQELIVLANSRIDLHAVAQARESCTDRLPGYMVPTFFIPVSRIPLSTNNKTDAKTLKELFYNMSLEELQTISAADMSSFSGMQKQLAEILSNFCEIPLDSMNPGSNIFELGLDSISVIGFCSKLKKAGFQNTTVARVLTSKLSYNTQGLY